MKKNREDHYYGYKFYKGLLGWVFKLYYRPTIINKEVIPKDGPIIVCGNHVHLYDQCLPILSTKKNKINDKFASKIRYDSK